MNVNHKVCTTNLNATVDYYHLIPLGSLQFHEDCKVFVPQFLLVIRFSDVGVPSVCCDYH